MSNPYEPQDPKTQLYLRFRKFQEWLPLIAVIVSAVAVIFVGYQSCINRDQLESMNKSVIEAKRGADAAIDAANAANTAVEQNKDLIEATKTQANASMTQANVSEKMAEQNDRLLTAAQTQADTSRVAAKAAEESAKIAAQSFSIGERPYIGTKAAVVNNFEAGQRPTITVMFDNTGKTPGLNATVRSYGVIRYEKRLGAVTYSPLLSVSTSIIQPGCCHRQTIPAFAPDLPQEAINTLIEAVKNGPLWLYVYGIAEYDDGAGKRHTLKFCQYYNREQAGLFTYCAEHNSSN